VITTSTFEPKSSVKWKSQIFFFASFLRLTAMWSQRSAAAAMVASGDKTASHYEIRQIGGQRYLFIEWKNGDVIIRGQKPMLRNAPGPCGGCQFRSGRNAVRTTRRAAATANLNRALFSIFTAAFWISSACGRVP
jgi:hypothetical protein